MQKQFQKQIDAGKMTQAQVDQVKSNIGRFSGLMLMVGGFAGPLFGGAIAPFLGGFILWGIGHLILRRPFDYLKGVEVSGMTLVIAGVGALIKGLLCAAMGTMFASPGLSLLVKAHDPTNLLHSFLLTFDVFVIWGVVVSGIALAKLSAVSFVKAFVWVFVVTFTITSGMLTVGWALQRMGERLSGG
jgi:hypothetical protein